ncbi:MAG: hypothetical protein ACE5NG_11215 [bacterium]
MRNIFNDLQGNAKENGQLKDGQRRQINMRLPEYLEPIPFQDGEPSAIRLVLMSTRMSLQGGKNRRTQG